MIYVSSQLDDYVTLNVEITTENVYGKCSDCGCETPVDLSDIEGISDLFAARWRCESCSYKHALKHRGEEWAEMVIKEHRFPLDD